MQIINNNYQGIILFSAEHQTRGIKWAEHVEGMIITDTYKILARKPQTSEMPSLEQEYNIKLDLGEIEFEVVGRIELARDKVQLRDFVRPITVMNIRVP